MTDPATIIVRLDKRMVKEAMVTLMEDLRFYARARNVDEVWGVATSLYEWQIVWYSKHKEINQHPEFFMMSKVYKLYYKEKQYTYTDIDLKFLIATLR